MPFQLVLESTFGTALLNKAKYKYAAKTLEKVIFAAYTAKTIGNECSLSVQSIWKMLSVKSEHQQTMQQSKLLLKRNGATKKALQGGHGISLALSEREWWIQNEQRRDKCWVLLLF